MCETTDGVATPFENTVTLKFKDPEKLDMIPRTEMLPFEVALVVSKHGDYIETQIAGKGGYEEVVDLIVELALEATKALEMPYKYSKELINEVIWQLLIRKKELKHLDPYSDNKLITPDCVLMEDE